MHPVAGPVGTRALLFSDIEGSTRLLAALGDGYPGVLADHRVLIRKAVAAHNGTEQSTGGDGLFVIFESARDAVAAAVDAQLALAAHPWPNGAELRVRMGVHAGEIEWAADDVVGMAIHEAARIGDAAHGGQVLVSPIVRDLAGGALPADVSLRSLGRHRLKDVTEPVELFQVCHPELPHAFPAPRTREAVVDLPVPRTSFVGREAELAEVLTLLAHNRHVTLTGVGGSGKTRLALEAARRDRDRHPDGVFFVDLAPIADPDAVLSAVATGVSVQGEQFDVEAMLLAYLRTRRTLVLIDNCEHLIDASAEVIDLVLGRCPGVAVLATSRESLQLEGEQTYRVPSLAAGDERCAAVELFVARARAAAGRFDLDHDNTADVVAICQRLDGIPLAIELAAARVDHLSVADIASRLDARFDLLVGGRRRRAQRQQTLQAAMDWSWELLSDDEQACLRRLAVFSGSFTLEAAESIVGMPRTVEVIRSLLAKSLVNLEGHADTTRYRLLETVRLYAQDRLVDSGEAAPTREAHADYYVELFDRISWEAYLDLDTIGSCLADHGNQRAALDWSTAQHDSTLVGRLVMTVGFTWMHSPSLRDEAWRWLQPVAEDETEPLELRGDIYGCMAGLAIAAGDLAGARRLAQRSLDLAPASDQRSIALWALGRYDEAIQVARELDLPVEARWNEGWAASTTIGIDPSGALARFEAVLGEGEPERHTWDRWWALLGSALARLLLGDGERALDDARTLDAMLTPYASWGGSLFRYGGVLESMALGHLGRFTDARAVLSDLAAATLRDHYPLVATDCVIALGYIALREGDVVGGAELIALAAQDGRFRCQPMYFFLGRILFDLHADGTAQELESPVPTIAEFIAHVTWVVAGEAPPDPELSASIDAILEDFVAAQA
jgi:predicted ATPase/class 3 adenylate cyclase